MHLADTNAISELRKGARADLGVRRFFKANGIDVFIPVLVIGGLRSGIERLRRKGDLLQVRILESWLKVIHDRFRKQVLSFDLECAELWGHLMGVKDQHSVDRQIAAIALFYDLKLVTRSTRHREGTGVRLLNPFTGDASPGKRTVTGKSGRKVK